MLLTPLRFVVSRYDASAHVWYPRFEPSITVPVLTLKRLRQSRQRYGMVLCAAPDWTLTDPQRGQAAPFGQRSSAKNVSAVASSGNMRMRSTSVIPSRWACPGAFMIPPHSWALLYHECGQLRQPYGVDG